MVEIVCGHKTVRFLGFIPTNAVFLLADLQSATELSIKQSILKLLYQTDCLLLLVVILAILSCK